MGGGGQDWEAVAQAPSGTGPWKLESFVPRERAEMVPNTEYWDETRIPKLDQMVLIPLPEPNARVGRAALRPGRLDRGARAGRHSGARGQRIRDRLERLSAQLDLAPVAARRLAMERHRVRKAANLAIDREGMSALLGGLMVPAEGFLPPGSQWFGEPEFDVRYDPEAAKALLAEAGYSPDNPLQVKALISPSGSGQMLPLPMNEYVQQNLAEVGIEVEFAVVEWNTHDQHLARRSRGSEQSRARIRSTSPISSRTRSPG